MSILLEAIKFNHDPTAATADGLNLRRNATQWVTVPEWQRGISVNPEDSPAAYAIKEMRGHVLTIQAQFRRTDPSIRTAQVRALDASAPLSRRSPRSSHLNILGAVQPRWVTFLPSGLTDFESFKLGPERMRSAGVGMWTTYWRWQYRLKAKGQWQDLTTTQHRIYTILELPTSPWQQLPYSTTNTQLPWTEVLDYACLWARFARTADAAAAHMTRSVYNLGPSPVTYDCPGGGSSHYAFPPQQFNCTAFLERLRGGIGNGPYINCTDCATIVATFANILGCDLWQSRMGWGFGLNPLLAIGSNIWQPACGWSSFNYHEVAWEGACTETEDVFDACLQVDGDSDPTAADAHHTPLLPTDMRFGNTGDGQYRDRLATPPGRPHCAPQPSTKSRRTIF